MGFSTINKLESIVGRSSIPQLIRYIYGVLQVTFYQWSAFLSNFFTAIPNNSKYHSFRVCPGVVFVGEFSDASEVQLTILKAVLTETMTSAIHLPEKAIIPGLDLNWQWYLYEQICLHCKSHLARDMTCP